MYVFSNRYKHLSFLGRGSTGEVLRVFDQKTGIECALKLLASSRDGVNRAMLEAFQNEFEILKGLNHPSIAKVYDTGFDIDKDALKDCDDEDDAPKEFYIASELIDGKNLFDATEKSSFSEKEDLFVQALRALNYLHEQKVYHLDIKPQNLLVTRIDKGAAKLKIIDFGFANYYERLLVIAKSKNEAPVIAGSPPFVAPEIIKGEAYDGRSDLYSLGCTFYKVLTRQPVFTGESDQEFHHKHLFQNPIAPSVLNPEIPKYLDQVILKLLEKNPKDRYATAAEVINDLNLLASKTYAIETVETSASYLPEKGKMIGREKEFSQFQEFYNDRLSSQEFTKKPYLLVRGTEGSGKTRFIQECKSLAQKNFVTVLSWTEFKNYHSVREVPTPALVLADDVKFASSDLRYIETFFKDKAVLVVLTCDDTPLQIQNPITLTNFNAEQTKEYILKATGFSAMPEKLSALIYERTHGNPLYLTEYLRALFEKGFFKDAQGTWSQKVLDDLGENLEIDGAIHFIKSRLQKKLKKLKLKESHTNLLYMMALYGKPTLDDMCDMTGGATIEIELDELIRLGILETDLEHRYVFANPLFKDILLESMSLSTRADVCDLIVTFLELKNATHEEIIYFKAMTNAHDAADSALEYVQLKRDELDFVEAKKMLLFLLQNTSVRKPVRDKALLALAEIGVELAEYNEAESWLRILLTPVDTNPPEPSPSGTSSLLRGGLNAEGSELLTLAKAYEQQGLIHYHRGEIAESTRCFEEGLKIVGAHNSPQHVILKGRIAQNEFDSGHTEAAEKILEETWRIWKNDLNEDEKILAARNNIDTIYYAKGEYQKAADFLEEYLSVIEKNPHSVAYASILYKLGRVYLKINRSGDGEEYLKQCIELMKDRHATQWLYLVYNELGIFYEKQKKYQESLEYYQHAFDLAHRKNVGLNLYAISRNIAQIFLHFGNFGEAEKFYTFTVQNLEEEDLKNDFTINYRLFMSYLGLAEICAHKAQFGESENYMQQAHALLQSTPNLNNHSQEYSKQEEILKKIRQIVRPA